jgi:hypothetical protein
MFQSSDLKYFPPGYTPGQVGDAAVIITSSSAGSTPAATSSVSASPAVQASQDGLSSGTKAGIAVGVVLSALMLLTSLIVFFLGRRKRIRLAQAALRGEAQGVGDAHLPSAYEKPELPIEGATKFELGGTGPQYELDGAQYELDGQQAIHAQPTTIQELQSTPPAAELEAGPTEIRKTYPTSILP